MLAHDSIAEGWELLGSRAPADLVQSRLVLHWAAQIPASIGYSLLDPQPDFGHLSLAWLPEARLLASPLAPTDPPIRAALRPSSLTLFVLDAHARPLRKFDLAGRTLQEGYAWLADAVEALTRSPLTLTRPDHELPEHPAAHGGRLNGAPPDLEELARWYANAHRVLQSLSQAVPEASPVRCWPHHFDVAVLMQYEADVDPEDARSIGVGCSPGDGSYAEPYWYVLPWPAPDPTRLPPLDGAGRWHTEGWVGAVLRGSDVVDAVSAADQAKRVTAFANDAVAASRRVLDLPHA